MATQNQKLVFNKVKEKIIKHKKFGKFGKIAISKEMEGIYSPNTAKTPNVLTDSKGWQELMDKYLPDPLLAQVHKEGLHAVKKEQRIVDRDEDGNPVYEMIDVDDFATRHKYLDSGYKLKRRYGEDPLKPGDTYNINLVFADVDIQSYENWRNERIHAGSVARSTEEISSDMGGGQLDEDGERNKT